MLPLDDEQRKRNLSIKLKLRKKAEQIDSTYILEISPELRKIMFKECHKLKIGWNVCDFKDYHFVMRCYHCSGFGHKSSECSHNKDKPCCGHCGLDHLLSDCNIRKERHFCVNCDYYNKKTNTKAYKTNHSSLSNECQSYQRMLSIVKSKFNYG
jgi:hypothetical protein